MSGAAVFGACVGTTVGTDVSGGSVGGAAVRGAVVSVAHTHMTSFSTPHLARSPFIEYSNSFVLVSYTQPFTARLADAKNFNPLLVAYWRQTSIETSVGHLSPEPSATSTMLAGRVGRGGAALAESLQRHGKYVSHTAST